MKLRQKLAVVLASAMVLTAVPVVTMAESKNTITKPNTIVSEDHIFDDATTAPALRINFDSFEGNEEFYLTLTNAKWATNEDGALLISELATDDVEITKVSSKVVKVVVKAMPEEGILSVNDTTVKLPLLAELTGGAASVAITTEGSNSTVTEGSYTFANTSDKVATATVDKATSINGEGKLGTIILAESYAGSMVKEEGKNKYALVELNNSEFEFDLSNATHVTETTATFAGHEKYEMPVKFSYGFAGKFKEEKVNVFVSKDGDSMYVEMPDTADLKDNVSISSKGRIELDRLYVTSTVKNPAEGDITVDVSKDVEEARNLVVAVNGKYAATVGVTDNKEAATITAGQKEEVSFTFKETVDGTFTTGRSFEIMLDNGYFIEASKVEGTDKIDEAATKIALQNAVKSIKQKAGSRTTDLAKTTITDVEIEDDKVVGFKFTPAQVDGEIDSFTFKFDIKAGIEDKGEVKVSVDGRDLDEAVSAVIANIKTAVEVTTEAAVLKTGLLNQEAGKITIKESEAGILDRNEQVVVYLPEVKGISFSTAKDKLPEVTVKEGDIQVSDIKITEVNGKDALVMTIKRDSKTASTIEIANFHIDTDRTVAEGAYDVEIGGKAMTSHDKETMTIADFIKVGTANTEDLVGANGLAKGTSSFVIGENKYTLNGVEKTMDAASYIQDPGYTMIPVRYVAEAFGVQGNDILFSKGVVTIFAGNRTVQLTNGSDIAVVNGAKIQMATKVVVKDGRTYAPVGEIARILGVSASWDNTAKTATFTNK